MSTLSFFLCSTLSLCVRGSRLKATKGHFQALHSLVFFSAFLSPPRFRSLEEVFFGVGRRVPSEHSPSSAEVRDCRPPSAKLLKVPLTFHFLEPLRRNLSMFLIPSSSYRFRLLLCASACGCVSIGTEVRKSESPSPDRILDGSTG